MRLGCTVFGPPGTFESSPAHGVRREGVGCAVTRYSGESSSESLPLAQTRFVTCPATWTRCARRGTWAHLRLRKL